MSNETRENRAKLTSILAFTEELTRTTRRLNQVVENILRSAGQSEENPNDTIKLSTSVIEETLTKVSDTLADMDASKLLDDEDISQPETSMEYEKNLVLPAERDAIPITTNKEPEPGRVLEGALNLQATTNTQEFNSEIETLGSSTVIEQQPPVKKTTPADKRPKPPVSKNKRPKPPKKNPHAKKATREVREREVRRKNSLKNLGNKNVDG